MEELSIMLFGADIFFMIWNVIPRMGKSWEHNGKTMCYNDYAAKLSKTYIAQKNRTVTGCGFSVFVIDA